jgi:ABC-type polysaccharide/polyol phosphate transport system ATPase subunit
MDKTTAIKLTNVSKDYTILREKSTLVEKFVKRKNKRFSALKNINLTIQKGERVGIIGSNGSGKTTLLKIIGGITPHTTGTVETYGKIASLIDLEAGFHPDLTGEENIALNGLLVGMNQCEIKENKKKISNFSGIGQFIKRPFYTYSSGMKFRLALAVAVASKCKILLLDEIFLSGDDKFLYKTISWLRGINRRQNLTLVIAAHDPMFVWEFAQRYIMLDHGKIVELSIKDVMSIRRKNASLWKKIFPHSI